MKMKINWVNSFAAGILLATSLCGVVYFTSDSHVSKAASKPSEEKKTVVKPSEKEMKMELSSLGYVIQTKDEYSKTIETAKKDAAASEQKKQEPAKSETSKEATKLIINVTDGMTSIDVGKMLVAGKLISNAYNFSTDIEKKGLQNKLRPGVYTIDSNMSYDQIVAAIFH